MTVLRPQLPEAASRIVFVLQVATSEHSCGTLLWNTLVGHSCVTLLWDTLAEHSCGHSLGTPLQETVVGQSSKSLLLDTGHSCAKLL